MSWRSLTAVARADLLERLRRRSFLVVTAAVLWACFAAVPPPASEVSLLAFGGARGEYSSAWMGLMFGLVTVFLLPLPGFYLVRGAVDRDRSTRVGPILAATPMSRIAYLAGKAVSNLLLLTAILAIVSVAAMAMLLLRREVPGFDAVQLLRPIWAMGLPVLALVAALAVLFECLPGLRGGLGNVVYFFLWAFALAAVVEGTVGAAGEVEPSADPFGVSHALVEARQRVAAVDPGYDGGFRLTIAAPSEAPLTVVPWPPAAWSTERTLARLAWMLPPWLLVLLGAAVFDRFDPARARPAREAPRGWPRARRGSRGGRSGATSGSPPSAVRAPGAGPAELPPVSRGDARFGHLGALLAAELRLACRGQPLWWWLVAAALLATSLALPPDRAQANLLPFLWIWPILVWSPLGARDRLEGVEPLLRAAPGAAWRLTLAAWGAGAAVALAAAAGLAIRQLLAGGLGAVAALVCGALFIPALAVALGSLSGHSRAFEAVYLLWWYLAANGGAPLDFMGRTGETRAAGTPALYLALAAALVAVAYARRRGAKR